MSIQHMHMVLPWSTIISIHISEAGFALAVKLDHEAICHKLLVCGLTIYRMKKSGPKLKIDWRKNKFLWHIGFFKTITLHR